MDQQNKFRQLFKGMFGGQVAQNVSGTQSTVVPDPVVPAVDSQPDSTVQPTIVNSQPDESQKKAEEAVGTILEKIFSRVVQVLTEEDMKKVEELDKDDTTGNTVKYFIMTKVPNLEAIIQEEIEAMKQSLSIPQAS